MNITILNALKQIKAISNTPDNPVKLEYIREIADKALKEVYGEDYKFIQGEIIK